MIKSKSSFSDPHRRIILSKKGFWDFIWAWVNFTKSKQWFNLIRILLGHFYPIFWIYKLILILYFIQVNFYRIKVFIPWFKKSNLLINILNCLLISIVRKLDIWISFINRNFLFPFIFLRNRTFWFVFFILIININFFGHMSF